ncbi:unnamed protein product [Cyprideis torosa]|uniref:Uncharacterized protein n=1 Tax=Cyprideis torosa TaxID=163714 RepID=A0A7R8W5I1_9CRUS|nr:unnamed protein product [Cyprideis torosa]CAG0879903.1 unnamed protein product [Cyprideis torosa]
MGKLLKVVGGGAGGNPPSAPATRQPYRRLREYCPPSSQSPGDPAKSVPPLHESRMPYCDYLSLIPDWRDFLMYNCNGCGHTQRIKAEELNSMIGNAFRLAYAAQLQREREALRAMVQARSPGQRRNRKRSTSCSNSSGGRLSVFTPTTSVDEEDQPPSTLLHRHRHRPPSASSGGTNEEEDSLLLLDSGMQSEADPVADVSSSSNEEDNCSEESKQRNRIWWEHTFPDVLQKGRRSQTPPPLPSPLSPVCRPLSVNLNNVNHTPFPPSPRPEETELRQKLTALLGRDEGYARLRSPSSAKSCASLSPPLPPKGRRSKSLNRDKIIRNDLCSNSSLSPRESSLNASEYEAEFLKLAPWFQAGIPREVALEILRDEPFGTFIVRRSTTKLGCFALTVRVPPVSPHTSGIAHYLIVKTEKGRYAIKGFVKEFPSLLALITHHSVMAEQLPVPLLGVWPKMDHTNDDASDFPDYETLATLKKNLFGNIFV